MQLIETRQPETRQPETRHAASLRGLTGMQLIGPSSIELEQRGTRRTELWPAWTYGI